MTAVEYIEESGVPESMWPNLAQWYGWFEKQDMVGIVKDGEDVFVDLTISSKGAKSLRCLLLLLWERFGPRRRITFNRLGKPRSYDYMNFMRKAMS